MIDNVNKWLADCSFEDDYNRWRRIERDIDNLLDNNQQQQLLQPKRDDYDAGIEVFLPKQVLLIKCF